MSHYGFERALRKLGRLQCKAMPSPLAKLWLHIAVESSLSYRGNMGVEEGCIYIYRVDIHLEQYLKHKCFGVQPGLSTL